MTDAIRRYLGRKSALAGRPVAHGPLDGAGQAVVIPALAESACLFDTLETLAANDAAERGRTLVVCVINNNETASPAQCADNQQTLHRLHAMQTSGAALRLAVIDAASPGYELPARSGVGMARKLGLDWAAGVLESNGAARGPLICLDADTHVEPRYLDAISGHFARPDAWAAVLAYAHRPGGDPRETRAILCYELFLRYHALGLRYAGSPYAFHTIGSAMACTAEAYAAVSGMNTREAGEDFYFLQQLAKTGPVACINATTVHPAGRASTRVPFGTGRSVLNYMDDPEAAYRVYAPENYGVIKRWLELVDARLDAGGDELLAQAESISRPLCNFLILNQFAAVWAKLRANNPQPERLRRAFNGWFDAFRTLKLIHHLRDHQHPQEDLLAAIHQMLAWCAIPGMEPPSPAPQDDGARQHALLAHLRQHA